MTESNLTTNPSKNNYPPYFEMKLVLQQDLMRNVTKDKIEDLKLLIEEYQHSHVVRSDLSSSLNDNLVSMSNLISSYGDILNDIRDSLFKGKLKGKKDKGNKGGK